MGAWEKRTLEARAAGAAVAEHGALGGLEAVRKERLALHVCRVPLQRAPAVVRVHYNAGRACVCVYKARVCAWVCACVGVVRARQRQRGRARGAAAAAACAGECGARAGTHLPRCAAPARAQ